MERAKEFILDEAKRLVLGDRGAKYGHPLDNFTNTADIINALFKKKLRYDFTAEDVALLMICLKLSREIHVHTRDNLVDIAGYAQTAALVHAARRGNKGWDSDQTS